MSKRSEEVAHSVANIVCICPGEEASSFEYLLVKYLDSLPEFQTKNPAWIKCSDRMPVYGESIYWFYRDDIIPGYISAGYWRDYRATNAVGMDDDDVRYWMPRFDPNPPEKENERDKDILEFFCKREMYISLSPQDIAKKISEIIEKHEGIRDAEA